jgi:60 kDa SS-A/Ro ribonucleoprotein
MPGDIIMSKNYATVIGAVKKNHIDQTPQTQPLPNQVANHGGGYSFAVDEWKRLERFLIIGSEGGTYYVDETKLTKANAKSLSLCIGQDGKRVVDLIVAISDGGRAPKNAAAVFALAMTAATGSPEVKKYAFMNMPKVARNSTDMFSFVEQYKQLDGGFGVVPKKGISAWYQNKSLNSLAYQLIKYRQRDGWTHHDVLSLAHVKAASIEENALYAYAKYLVDGNKKPEGQLPRAIEGYELIKGLRTEDTIKEAVKLIVDYKLPWEAVPTELLKSAVVWEALLPEMGATALVRNLGRLTTLGLIKPFSDGEKLVRDKLSDSEYIKDGRLHPISVLVAAKVYANGRGDKGSLVWTPSPKVLEGLNEAFYATFANAPVTNKRIMVNIDVSGSMIWPQNMVRGVPNLTSSEACGALALVILATEPNAHLYAYSDSIRPVDIDKGMRLDRALSVIQSIPMGATDCALPFIYAKKHNLNVDAFMSYTDNETNSNSIHPSQAVKSYRKSSGIAAKSIVLAASATEMSIADPTDSGTMDVVGYDSNVPLILSDFIK